MSKATGMESLEQKIEKAQADVVKTKQRYDGAVTVLKDLMNKRDALRRDELITAIMKSSKPYDEILQFIQSDD